MALVRRRFLLLLTGAVLILPGSVPAATIRKKTPPPKAKERVVIQVSDSDSKRWNLALTTAKTLQSEYGEDKIDVAIIAMGPGVNMAKDDADVANRVQAAIARKIFVIACGSSMKALNLSEDGLPSGAAELVKRQRDGWVYLRP
jgi:hypothetical protein